MRESIEQSGVFFQLGFMRRFDSGYAAAKARVDDGAIGDPVVFKSTSRDPYPPSLSYADPRSSGGLIIDMGIHDFAGEPLMDGPGNPHDILSVLGEKALHAYLVNEIQEVDAISVLLPTVDVVFLY